MDKQIVFLPGYWSPSAPACLSSASFTGSRAVARPGKRPVVLTGDGAFRMSVQEVSTLVDKRSPAVIVVINNDGYLINRALHPDRSYNDIRMRNYSRLSELFDGKGFVVGMQVSDEEGLDKGLQSIEKKKDRMIVIEACLPSNDYSEGMRRLGEAANDLP